MTDHNLPHYNDVLPNIPKQATKIEKKKKVICDLFLIRPSNTHALSKHQKSLGNTLF